LRLTRDEVQANRKLLTQWQRPADMRIAAEQLMDHLGSEDLFNQSGLEFVLEAAAASEFAEKRGARSVRLLPADRPDCELMFSGDAVEAFEIVEADILGRKRGLEYREKAASGKATDWPIEEWATPDQARQVLQIATGTKAAKARDLASKGIPYPPGTNLLIYLNIYDFGVHHDAIKNEFVASVEIATAWFPTIWILWKGIAYCVFGRQPLA
jgi:hypothetical protein